MELVFTEMGRGDRFREDSESLVLNELILRSFLEISKLKHSDQFSDVACPQQGVWK